MVIFLYMIIHGQEPFMDAIVYSFNCKKELVVKLLLRTVMGPAMDRKLILKILNILIYGLLMGSCQ